MRPLRPSAQIARGSESQLLSEDLGAQEQRRGGMARSPSNRVFVPWRYFILPKPMCTELSQTLQMALRLPVVTEAQAGVAAEGPAFPDPAQSLCDPGLALAWPEPHLVWKHLRWWENSGSLEGQEVTLVRLVYKNLPCEGPGSGL